MSLVSDAITSIRYGLKDTSATSPNWADAEILDYINNAQDILFQRMVARKSDIITLSTSATLVAGTEICAVPTGFWQHKTLFITGEESVLSQVDYRYILEYNEAIGDDQDVPTCFAIFNDKFYLRPIPDSGYTLKIHYYAQPSALTTGSPMPFKEIFNQAIKEFAKIMCFQRDEYNTDREMKALDMLYDTADKLARGRNKSLKRAIAYRWEYEGLI